MGADRLTQAVRHQLGLGRLLPLGDTGDGAWLTEETARAVLRRAAAHAMPSVRLDALRLSSNGPDSPDTDSPDGTEQPTAPVAPAAPAVPAPPSALPPGPLRLEGELAVTVEEPLPVVTEALRKLLLTAADRELGLVVGPADLRVTDLLMEPPEAETEAETVAEPEPEPEPRPEKAEGDGGGETEDDLASAVAGAVLAVPGVARMAPVLGSPLTVAAGSSPARAVRVSGWDSGDDGDGVESGGGGGGGGGEAREGAAPPHVLLQLAVAPGHRALDVARGARAAAAKAAAREVTVAVLVTAVDPG